MLAWAVLLDCRFSLGVSFGCVLWFVYFDVGFVDEIVSY